MAQWSNSLALHSLEVKGLWFESFTKLLHRHSMWLDSATADNTQQVRPWVSRGNRNTILLRTLAKIGCKTERMQLIVEGKATTIESPF